MKETMKQWHERELRACERNLADSLTPATRAMNEGAAKIHRSVLRQLEEDDVASQQMREALVRLADEVQRQGYADGTPLAAAIEKAAATLAVLDGDGR